MIDGGTLFSIMCMLKGKIELGYDKYLCNVKGLCVTKFILINRCHVILNKSIHLIPFLQMLPANFFKNYSSTKHIDLSNTGLQRIEDYTFSIASMIELNLRGNDLTRLTQNAFDGAVNLASLDLSRNLISFIDPSAFNNLHSLINLNLSHNKLSNQSFSDDDNIMGIDWTIEKLQVLDLSHNGIVYYDALPYNSFTNMKRLEELYLQYNHMAIDYGAFSSNPHLKTLDFSYNNNPYFEFNLFLSLRKLENIYLNGNGMWHSIDLTDIRSSFPKLTSIGISNNSFPCSILASIVRKLDKAGIEMIVDENAFVTNARNIRGVKCI
jgi:Leucine-rich repeat (LRR) protein